MNHGAYDELLGAALGVLNMVKRYETAIKTGDVSTRVSAPVGDKSRPTGRLIETAILTAAYAYVRTGGVPAGPVDERDASIDSRARLVAAQPEFRAAIEAAVQMALVRPT